MRKDFLFRMLPYGHGRLCAEQQCTLDTQIVLKPIFSNIANKKFHMYCFNLLRVLSFALVFFPFYVQAKSINKNNNHKSMNIILFIGDGMGLAQWQTGMVMSDGQLNIKRMHSIGLMQTNSQTDFIGDGPSNGTAIASGVNTHKGYIGIDVDEKPVKSIMEYATQHKIATGIVSANTLFEGSIAPFVAHVKSRMQTEDIAKAYVELTPNVFIGGGMHYFTAQKDGQNLLETLKNKGYHVVKSMNEMRSIHDGKLAGLISETNMPDISQGRGNSFAESIHTAINILNQSENGFILLAGDMFVDRASHACNAELVGRETIDFDKAIGIALDFAEKEGNTLVLVAGGPEASGMVLVGGDITKHEVTAKWAMQGMIHTGTLAPVFSYGPGAERFQGIIKNTDLFFHMKDLLLDENK